MPLAEETVTITIPQQQEGEEIDVEAIAAKVREKMLAARKKIAEQLKRIKVILFLDASGSMRKRANDVIGSASGYLETLRTDGNTYDVSLYLFNNSLTPVFTNISLTSVSTTIIAEKYITLGSTAFYDSMAEALSIEKKEMELPGHSYGVSPTFFVIDTDGEENASKHTTKEEIIAMIKRREAAGNWTFVYMGADQDAWSLAQTIGLSQDNVVSYASADIGGTYQKLAHSTTASATSASSGGPISTRSFFHPTTGTAPVDTSSIIITTTGEN